MRWRLTCVLLALSVLLACGNKNEPATSSNDSGGGASTEAAAPAPKSGMLAMSSKPEVVPAGKAITVRMSFAARPVAVRRTSTSPWLSMRAVCRARCAGLSGQTS